MELREIQLLGTLMRVGTTTETAQLLRISQPGVSAQLKRLEERVGVVLFHRTGKRLSPTKEAEEIYALSKPIFDAHAKIRGRLPALRSRRTEPPVLSVTPALVDGFLGSILRRAGYRDWKKSLKLLIHAPEEDLRNQVADIGLQMAAPPKAEFKTHIVGQTSLVAVMQADHPLAKARELVLEEIAKHPLVCYDPDWSPMGAHIRSAFRDCNVDYEPVCTTPFCADVCSLVRDCGGVGIVDEMTARRAADQNLRWLPIRDITEISIVAFYRRNESFSAGVYDLLSAILEEPV
ncbi:LysR family transcriptional regulator [Sulfitobacter dubius]|uniref:LysR family transcriptional regulator n=1 Tax=Sulfitobacter dubius TaxID=218673 RepID=UPI002941CE9D|nr:LysR family transcriptional regulator [Sulfitobacter dubius]WOI30771.1 LysR family transcriptional regulator [Sulfitobacter dubius]